MRSTYCAVQARPFAVCIGRRLAQEQALPEALKRHEPHQHRVDWINCVTSFALKIFSEGREATLPRKREPREHPKSLMARAHAGSSRQRYGKGLALVQHWVMHRTKLLAPMHVYEDGLESRGVSSSVCDAGGPVESASHRPTSKNNGTCRPRCQLRRCWYIHARAASPP